MLSIQDVSMRFRKEEDHSASLKETVINMFTGKLKITEFYALKHVSFDVYKGDVLGIIGRNGAGKSTILKIISGIMKPTEGTVERRGNIVPMLELGSGFDMDLSGRENVFLNGAILGYEKQFLYDRYDEILDFSELHDFINMPLRNYSSGMIMRLAFSIATVVEPEILIVDEILAVGDENFQRKSRARMMELMSGGTTVLFVSHDLNQIREMCNRVVWLDGGTVRLQGECKEVCDQYRL
ncbi:MAG: ABC transporter ATP-binding protein [Lachnospiraceae bacterium]|nr:ABC transporter ATP-binding protein [Lachnospiraceae bacterium]